MNYFMYIWYDLTIVTRVILCIFYIHPELRYLWIAKVMDAITVLESQHSQAGLHGQDNEDGQDGQDCQDGQGGQDDQDGQDGLDGQDGQDG